MSNRAQWVGAAIAVLLLFTIVMAGIKVQLDRVDAMEGKYCLIIRGQPVETRCVESTIIVGNR